MQATNLMIASGRRFGGSTAARLSLVAALVMSGAAPSSAQPTTAPAPYYEAIGDSITYGDANPDPALDAYPNLIGQLYGYDTHNLGTRRANAPQMVTQELPSVRAGCAIATIYAGHNDLVKIFYHHSETLAQYESAMNALIAGVNQKCPRAHIFVFEVAFAKINAFNPVINAFIDSLPATYPYVRVVPITKDVRLSDGSVDFENAKSYYNADRIHPNLAGQAILALDAARIITAQP